MNPTDNPYLFPPDNSDSFHRFASVDAAPGATVTLVQLKLAPGEVMRISGFGINIKDDPPGKAAQGFANGEFNLVINEVEHLDFCHIKDQLGRTYAPCPVLIRVRDKGAKIVLSYKNNSGVDTYTAMGRLDGWSFPAPPGQ